MKLPVFRKKTCPECGQPLHIGQHKFSEGAVEVEYCKNCGFKAEEGLS